MSYMDDFFTDTVEGREIMTEIDDSIAEERACRYMSHMGARWAAGHRMQVAMAGVKASVANHRAWDKFRAEYV